MPISRSNDDDFDVVITVGNDGEMHLVAPTTESHMTAGTEPASTEKPAYHDYSRIPGRRGAGEIGPKDYSRALAVTSPAGDRSRSEVRTVETPYGETVGERTRPTYPLNVEIHEFGDAHKIAFLKTRDDTAVGHLIWDTTSGDIKDLRVVSHHRHNGLGAMRLLNDAWTNSAENGHAGPTGGNVLTPSAWGAQRTLNPGRESFKEHPWTQQGAIPGIGKFMHAPLSQEDYDTNYAKPLTDAVANHYASKVNIYERRVEPNFERHVATLRHASVTNRDSFSRRKREAADENAIRNVPFHIRSEVGATGLQSEDLIGSLPSVEEMANRALLSGASFASGYVPEGACKSCGGRGVDKIVTQINAERDYLNTPFSGDIHADHRDDEHMSFVHPQHNLRVTIPALRDLRAAEPNSVVSVGEGHIMVERPCEACHGTGKE